MWYVYIIRCADDTLYTGVTTDVARRFEEHRTGVGAKYTRTHKAVELVYQEECVSRAAACKREAEIKSWPRSKKCALIRARSSREGVSW